VELALQACFGGVAALYNVQGLRDRSFRFSVSSSAVGFEIYNQGVLAQSSFKIFFNLWGQGGPNWIAEEKKFYKEQDKEWTEVRSKVANNKSVFTRLSPAQNVASSRRVSVFDRLEHSSAAPTVTNFGQSYGAFKDRFNGLHNDHYFTGQRYFHQSSNQPTRFHLGAKLPGFLSSFKFPSFPSLAWPDSSYQFWFKAHGHAPQIQSVTSFGDFSFLHKQVADSVLRVASSPSSPLSLHPENPLPSSATLSPVNSPTAMANIPIDPRPFVPHGFEIQHIEGRVGVKRVVVTRKPRLHEQYAIATINPFPQGQVHFQNVRGVLEDF
jgi:hypothetical protein